jgi:hypothetical protein
LNTKQRTIAKRLVECEQWKWMPGMRALNDLGEASRLHLSGEFTAETHQFPTYGDWPADNDNPFGAEHHPDLADPATHGCLLAMLGEVFAGLTSIADEELAEMARRVFGSDPCELGQAIAESLLDAWAAPPERLAMRQERAAVQHNSMAVRDHHDPMITLDVDGTWSAHHGANGVTLVANEHGESIVELRIELAAFGAMAEAMVELAAQMRAENRRHNREALTLIKERFGR